MDIPGDGAVLLLVDTRVEESQFVKLSAFSPLFSSHMQLFLSSFSTSAADTPDLNGPAAVLLNQMAPLAVKFCFCMDELEII